MCAAPPEINSPSEKQIREDLQCFRDLINGVAEYAIFLLDPVGIVKTWNLGAERIKGYPAAQIIGRHFACFYTVEDQAAGRPGLDLERAAVQGKYEAEGWRLRRDGSGFWAYLVITPLRNPEGILQGFSKITRDVTDRVIARNTLAGSERHLRLLADAMPQMVLTAGADGSPDYFNGRWCDWSGMRSGEVTQGWASLLHASDLELFNAARLQALETGTPFEIESRLWYGKSGQWRWHLGRGVPLPGEDGSLPRWVFTFTDVDDQHRLNERLERRVADRTRDLERSLKEKTILLREVHHRVKNNLQIICSLLALQMDYCGEDSGVIGHLQEAHHRVVAMSLIHEELYQGASLSRLDFGGYIERLCAQLVESYSIDRGRIRLALAVEPVELSMDQALPCGLILNELVSNALKHAFPIGTDGIISVVLRTTPGNRIVLEVSDDGRGLPSDFSIETSHSMGLQVVHALTAQLGASLTILPQRGTTFILEWKRCAQDDESDLTRSPQAL